MNKVRELRDERGLSLADLAKITGKSRMAINRIERGERKLTMDWARLLADAMGVSVEEVYGGRPGATLITPEWLSAELERRGIRRVQIANELGLTRSAITMMLKGDRRITESEARTINDFLARNDTAFISNDEEKTDPIKAIPLYRMERVNSHYVRSEDPESSIRFDMLHDDCFALTYIGSENSPKFENGETLLIAESKTPRTGEYTYAELNDGEILIGRLVSYAAGIASIEFAAMDKRRDITDTEILRICKVLGSVYI